MQEARMCGCLCALDGCGSGNVCHGVDLSVPLNGATYARVTLKRRPLFACVIECKECGRFCCVRSADCIEWLCAYPAATRSVSKGLVRLA